MQPTGGTGTAGGQELDYVVSTAQMGPCPARTHLDQSNNCIVTGTEGPRANTFPDGKCPDEFVQIPGSGQCVKPKPIGSTGTGTGTPTGGTGTGTTTTGDTPATPSTPKKTGTTTGTGGTTTTTTGNPNTPTKPATATTTTITTNVIRGGSSGGGSGGATAPTSGLTISNNFLNYVNPAKKITIKYPSTWTKTELVGNPNIPVIFNAPLIITAATTPNTAAAAPKTSFVINVTPSAANLDNYTQQQIEGLTRSNAVKYTITNTNAKELTPPTGITAFREIIYDGMKIGLSANNTPTQVPLKGAAIFFVNGGTGYSLLYLAKQNEYTQNLPMIQQMVNSFQVGTGATTANSAGSPSP